MKKSFAYITSLRIPNEFANSIYVVKICEAVNKLGWATTLLVPDKTQPKYFPHNDIYNYYQLKKNSFSIIKFKVIEFNQLNELLEKIFKHFRFQFIIWSLMFQSIYYLVKNKVKVVETMDREIIFLLRLVFWYKPKVIYDVHIGPKTWYENLFDRLIIPRVNLFMVNCKYFNNYYSKKIRSDQKIVTLPNGFEPKHYQLKKTKSEIRKDLNLPVNSYILGYIGRLETFGVNKGAPIMLKTIATMKSKNPISVVIIGGPKNYVEKYQKLAKKLGLNRKQAIIRDQVSPSMVAEYIKAFDIACMIYPDTDHYRNKMSPMKAIEYMAGNKPIIASNLPSIKQILGNNAYYVSPDNLLELKDSITAIINNPSQAKEKANKAKQLVQQYTWVNRQKSIFSKLNL